MPLRDDGSTDGLLKLLHIELVQAEGGVYNLGKWGWFQFRNLDHPKTTDPVQMASCAFVYLSIDDDGAWRQNQSVIQGTLSFLQRRRQASPSDEQLDDLYGALAFCPVEVNDVRAWFVEVFPPLE